MQLHVILKACAESKAMVNLMFGNQAKEQT